MSRRKRESAAPDAAAEKQGSSEMATAVVDAPPADPNTLVAFVPVQQIRASKTNPRKHFSASAQAELEESIRKHGVLQPVLVRRTTGPTAYELVAGERRFRAAQAVGLSVIPATIRHLSDVDVLEIQVIENLQRADLHPLEEADGYRALVEKGRYEVARIAERVGRSVAYVYDRLKLCELSKKAREVFAEDRITVAHAIVLARLKATDQDRVVETEGALFTLESGLFDKVSMDEPDPLVGMKPRSVRELQAWIDTHVRFDAKEVDAMLFPETAATVQEAQAAEQKVVLITHDYMLPADKKDEHGAKTYTARAWKRADGEPELNVFGQPKKTKSKTCDHSVVGVIAIGEGRGDSFRVCIAKEKCKVHWGAEIAAKAKKAATPEKSAAPAKQKEDRWERERRLRETRVERWKKAKPEIEKAVCEVFGSMKFDAAGPAAKLVRQSISYFGRGAVARTARSARAWKETAEDLVLEIALLKVLGSIDHVYDGGEEATKLLKPFGVDAKKLLDKFAPVEKPKKAAKAKDKRPKAAAEDAD